MVPAAPGGLAGTPDQPIFRSPRAREGLAVVQPLGELRHQRRHLLAQLRVEPEPLDPEIIDLQVEPAGILDDDLPVIATHRCPAELDADIVHGHHAVVEDEPAVDVVHPQLDRPAGVQVLGLRRPHDHQPDVRLRPRIDHDVRLVLDVPASTSTVAVTSQAPEGLIVRQAFFHSVGSALRSSSLNGRFSAFRSTWTLSG